MENAATRFFSLSTLMSPMSLLTARCLNGNSGTLGFNLRSTFRCCALWKIGSVNLAATSSVAPLPAEATTSLLPIAFIGYLSSHSFCLRHISRRRTLMTRNRTIHFNCAKLGRCSGCKGKCALRVPPCFASLQQGNHPCGSTSLLRPLDCT